MRFGHRTECLWPEALADLVFRGVPVYGVVAASGVRPHGLHAIVSHKEPSVQAYRQRTRTISRILSGSTIRGAKEGHP